MDINEKLREIQGDVDAMKDSCYNAETQFNWLNFRIRRCEELAKAVDRLREEVLPDHFPHDVIEAVWEARDKLGEE